MMWVNFSDLNKETVSMIKAPLCGCEIPEFVKHSPESKWIMMQKHEFVFDHRPVYPCAECGILATNSALKIHQKFSCKDHKAQALHKKKPHHEVFHTINGV